jgi:hypothetical protein
MPVADARDELAPVETARTVSQDLNRELLRKAHAHARQRQQDKTYSIAPQRGNEPEPLVISNQYIPPSRDAQIPTSKGITDYVFEFGGRGNDDAFDAVPDVDESRNDPPARPIQPRLQRQSRPRVVEERRLSAPAEVDKVADIHAAPVAPAPSQRIAPAAEAWTDDAELSDRYESEVESLDDIVGEPGIADYRYPDSDIDLDGWATARQVVRQSETHRLWADIPRCCMTCRDFRPAGNGERGWCTNQWAFKHRRMVDADDRPCETSIGHWWIPGDEAWQGEFDISALGQPTPLMDKWFGRSIGDEPTEAPAERRRRRTGSW